MKPRRILIATDFSPASHLAFEVASRLARVCGAKLIILHVEPGQPTAEMGPAYYGIADPNISEIARSLAALKPESPEVSFEHVIQAGDPATEVQRVAKEQSADLIVIGSRARKAVTKVLLGSVANSLLHTSACPILICHEAAVLPKPELMMQDSHR